MQKKLIALAVAGLVAAPVAMAQENVTIYGVADMSVGSIKANGGKNTTRVEDNVWASSRLGFRGTEDLGNGLKATFQFEMGTLDLDGGGAVAMGRDTFVGLTGDFGTVRAGRFLSIVGQWGAPWDVTVANQFRTDWAGGGVTTGGAAFNAATSSIRSHLDVQRVSSALEYTSPNMSGLTVKVMWAPDENAAIKNDRASVGVRYVNGPLDVGYVYHELNDTYDYHLLGGSYNFGAVALKGQYGQGKVDGASDREKHWSLGAAVPVGAAGSVTLAYGQARDIGSTKNRDSDMWAVTYRHSLSKRSTLYAGFSDRDFDNTNNVGDQRVFALGMIHTF